MKFGTDLSSFTTAEKSIFKIILENIKSKSCSTLIRTSFSIIDLIGDFPDRHHSIAETVVQKMVELHLLIVECGKENTIYRFNPNKSHDLKSISLSSIKPMEESVPSNYVHVFQTDGLNTSKGNLCKYHYFRDSNDNYRFIVIIHSGDEQRRQKIDVGSLCEGNSQLSDVRQAIEKLKKNTFYKSEIGQFIINKRIIQNRQPLKAVFDILEFLGYITKTGIKKGRSEEYQIKNNSHPNCNLDKFLDL